mgnify:CR=1 FL=1
MDLYAVIFRIDKDGSEWSKIENPLWEINSLSNESRALSMMINSFNDYVEYRNCGVIYRVIRTSDMELYESK